MQRPVNSRIRHGMPTCARYGCKREECVEALRVYKRENYKERKGGVQANVPCDNALIHIQLLMRKDMSAKDIATVSGVCEKIILKVLQGAKQTIHWTTEEAILGVPVPEFDWTPMNDGYTDPTGSTRRVRALSVQGFSAAAISAAGKIPVRNLRAVRSAEHPRILISGARAIKAVHDLLWDADPLEMGLKPGDVTRTRRYAESMGWHPTEAWADIDDPNCKPTLGTPRYITLTEDARELTEQQGYTMEHAAKRLGVTVNAIQKARKRYREAMAEAS